MKNEKIHKLEQLDQLLKDLETFQLPYIDFDPDEVVTLISNSCTGNLEARFYDFLGKGLISLDTSSPDPSKHHAVVNTVDLSNTTMSEDLMEILLVDKRLEKIVVTALLIPNWCSHWYEGDPLNPNNYSDFIAAYNQWATQGRSRPKKQPGRPKNNSLVTQHLQSALQTKWKEYQDFLKERKRIEAELKLKSLKLYDEYMALKNQN